MVAKDPASKASMGRRVRRILNLALNPPSQADPDPGNPVPFIIRKDILKYRMAFYIGLGALIGLTITTPRTYLFDSVSNAFRPEQLTTGLVFLFLVLLSHYLVTGSDPGYLDIDVAIHLGQEHAQHEEISAQKPQTKRTILKSTSNVSEVIISSPVARNVAKKSKDKIKVHAIPMKQDDNVDEERKDDSKQSDEDDDDLESSRLIDKESDIDGEADDENDDELDDDEPDEVLDQSLSGIPAQQLPIRAKFCRKSKRVVATYDHHCRFLNTTIGERNRARFWFLLLWSTCGISWLLSVVHSGFRNSLPSVGAWFERNGHALTSAILCWLLLLVCGGLFVFHTFLMLANVTTYEFMRADKVTYLADTRDFDLPFSMGLAANARFYFASDSFVLRLFNLITGRKIEWKPHFWTKPAPSSVDRNSADVCKNVWENRYWSCC